VSHDRRVGRHGWRVALSLVVAFAGAVQLGCAARTASSASPRSHVTGDQAAATAATFERLRHDPVLRRVFLRELPKGGDLHVHVSGGIYAENFIRWAAEDGLCLDPAQHAVTRPPCDPPRIPASSIAADASLYDRVIDEWSMRNWHPALGSGHGQFFDSFGKFGGAGRSRWGDMLAEISARAAAQHVSYLELMIPVDDGAARRAMAQVSWTGDPAAARDALLAAGLREGLQQARRALDTLDARRREVLRCDGADADPGCGVTIRYLQVGLRAAAPIEIYSQLLAGFEMARLDPRVVGVNIAQPEDAPVPIRDFRLHMRMLEYLHGQYPEVGITLHAGELVEGLVPPEDLRFHIRASIDQGRARRIGHGVDVMYEDDALGLLQQMARDKVLVEIALSSNDGILGVRGARHPLRTYLAYGVPVALATDDEGVSRSSLTREFERAVEEHDLDYPTLKALARNALQFSFVQADEKATLLEQFDADVRAFEAKWAAFTPPAAALRRAAR